MNALWSLPRAAPILLRHLSAYAELAAQDLAKTREHVGARIGAAVLFLVGVFFAILMACVAIIAAAWETPYRMIAIYVLLGVFVLIAVVTGNYAARVRREQSPLFASVRREWEIDRVIFERILNGHDASAEARDTSAE